MSVTGDAFHALEQHVARTTRRDEDGLWHRECAWCGDPFTATNVQQQYCSRAELLAAVNLDRDGWREHAACAHCDPPDLFYPQGEHGDWLAVIDEAKQVCAACPVRADCLEYALDAREDFGIWGGLTEAERRPLLRRRVVS